MWFSRRKPTVTVHVFGKTDTGRQRDHNEDAFLVADLTAKIASLKPEVREHALGERGSLFLVADGMGGAAAGEIASEMATETIYQHLVDTWANDKDLAPQQFAFRLREAVELANAKIHEHAQQHPERRGMGTTTTTVGVLGDTLYLANVGDSRAYLIRGGNATQITKDQSLMQRLVDAGELTEEEAEKSERRNIILQALGPEPNVRVDLTHQELRHGDVIVVCSDGLSGQVTKEDIAGALTATEDPVEACGRLIDLANERGGPDNITVVVAQFTGDALKPVGDDDATVGHRIFPMADTDSDTEPVPAYREPPPEPPQNRTPMVIAALASALILIASLLLAA